MGELTPGEAVTRMRTRMRGETEPWASHADLTFSGADTLADWLQHCAALIRRGEFVIPPMGGVPDTLYLWLNDAAFNPDRWFLAPFAFAWTGRPDPSPTDDLRDDVLGSEVGDVKTEAYTLVGMEALQRTFADDVGPAHAGRFVTASAMALVDDALPLAGDLGLRVGLSCSEEQVVALWTRGEDSWHAVVHVDDPAWD